MYNNVCSGRGYTARQVLEILLDLAHVKVSMQEDPARMRPSDVTLLLGDCSKFQSATGWQPTIPFEVTLKDLLEHWRRRAWAGPAVKVLITGIAGFAGAISRSWPCARARR